MMDFTGLCIKLNNFFSFPATILFLFVSIYFTVRLRCIQICALPRFFSLLFGGVAQQRDKKQHTINTRRAVLTAMSSTIGMGNIVGPSIAIVVGGPGALFWLVLYAFLSSATKFVEVTYALTTRTVLKTGNILGGPTQYLKLAHPLLASWYSIATIFLFAGWSGMQANTIANIYVLEHCPKALTGLLLAAFLFFILIGGIRRIGMVVSRLVPTMFVLYVIFSGIILLSDLPLLCRSFSLIFHNVFYPCAPVGGFLGASLFSAMRNGIFQSIYITESGLGTSSIAHAMADTKRPTDQGILAMISVAADIALSVLSGLLVLTTSIWMRGGELSNTLVYEVFRDYSSMPGKMVLLVSVTLFVLTTIIGNSFSAAQSFASITRYRWMNGYYFFLSVVVFAGALMRVPLIWTMMETLLAIVAIPHLIGLVILSIKEKSMLNWHGKD